MRAALVTVVAVVALALAAVGLWWWSRPEIIVLGPGGAADGGAPKSGLSFVREDVSPEALADAGVRKLSGRVAWLDEATPAAGATVEVYLEGAGLADSVRCAACEESAFQCGHHSTAARLKELALSGSAKPKLVATLTADAEGHFEREGVPGVPLLLIARTHGSAQALVWDPSGAGIADGESPEEPLQLVVEDRREIAFQVMTYRDEGEGTAVPGAEVLLWNIDTFELEQTRADGTGHIRTRASPGMVWVMVEAPGVVARGQYFADDNQFMVSPTHALVVHTTAGGAPVEAEVTLEGLHPETRKTVNGIARFPLLNGDETSVRAEAAGLVARHGDLWASLRDEEAHVELQLRKSARLLVAVLDGQGNPVPDATVSLVQANQEAANGTSTEKGDLIVLGPLPEGDAVLTVDTGEFRHEERHLVVKPGDQQLDVVLKPMAVIHGRVLEGDGSPAARVQVVTHSGLGGLYGDASDFTNPSGEFELRVEEAGAWTLDVTGPHGRARREVTAPAKGVEIRLDPMSTLDITVTDEGGQPMPRASVQIEDQTMGGNVYSTVDKDQHVRAGGLDPGTYKIQASADGHARVEKVVTVGDHRPVPVSIILPKGVGISGKVVDASGRPVPGTFVTIEGEPVGARTEDDGTYTLADLHAGQSYVVSLEPIVEGVSTVSSKKTVKAPATGVVFTVPDARHVRGRVIDEAGKPLAHFFAANTELSPSDGRFEVEVTGTVLAVYSAGYSDKVIDLPKGDDVGDVVLAPLPEIRGLVLDPGGQPSVGAVVQADGMMEGLATGADGSFKTRLSLSGVARFTARHGGYTGNATFDPEHPGPVTIRLAGPTRVHGVVYGAEGRPVPSTLVQYSRDDDSETGRVESSGEGAFELALPPGRYTFSTRALSAAQVVDVSGETQEVVLGRTGASCTLDVDANRYLDLVALVPADRAAPPPVVPDDAGVAINDVMAEIIPDLPQGSFVLTPPARTTHVHAEGVACGAYVLFVRGTGAVVRQSVTLRSGDRQPVAVVLSSSAVGLP